VYWIFCEISCGLTYYHDSPQTTDAGLFGAVYFATALISSFVTNNAAATLMFPIAIGAAETTGVDLKLMSYCLMLGASDFSTPFGYQTNLIVYGPGGYKVIFLSACLACSICSPLNLMTLNCHDLIQTTDYLKIGTPLQFVLWLVSTWVLSTSSLWYVSLVVTSIILIAVTSVHLGGAALHGRLKQGIGKN